MSRENERSMEIECDCNDLIIWAYNREGFLETVAKMPLKELMYHLRRAEKGLEYSEPNET